MSSPLDGRIRKLAREEAAGLLGVAPAQAAAGDGDRVEALEKEVATLRQKLTAAHERTQQALTGIEALTTRVQALEDAAAPTAKTTARRTARKESDDPHPA
jgi:septal ring factor EnvC (AmiA/AmiB activator)